MIIPASALTVCTDYLQESYLCIIWSILQQESAGIVRLSTQDTDQQIEAYK